MTSDDLELARKLGQELSDWRRWMARLVILAFAALAGLAVATFTWLCEAALSGFRQLHGWQWWWPLFWTPALTAAIVWATRR